MSSPRPRDWANGEDVESFSRRIFGESVARARGSLHPAAIWDGKLGRRVLRIGEHSPKSEIDYALLHLARARANVIVTTGEILRSEALLRHDLGAAAGLSGPLEDYRRRFVGIDAPLDVVVLSRGEVDVEHPGLHGEGAHSLFVPISAPKDLEVRANRLGIAVRRFERLDLDVALEALRLEGVETISVEAGVQTTAPRYEKGLAFDEELLSRFVGADVDERAIGLPFPQQEEFERLVGRARSSTRCDEPSGPWIFERFVRSPGKALLE